MTQLLQGKIVLVTGGASGIGRAICATMARFGAKLVIVADLQREPREGGASAEELVRSAGADAVFCRTDVSRRSDVEQALAIAESHGGLDVMVCNAGVASPRDGAELAEEEYHRIISVNLDGVFFGTQIAGLQMTQFGKAGSIILISSMGGILGSRQTVAYSATKGAVRLLASSFADAFGSQGIRVNAVCPGLIETALMAQSGDEFKAAVQRLQDRTPLRRCGSPEEVAKVCVWLASDLASFVTGTSIPVDGGLSSVL
jgi:L-rhamnose 1-dehydrogenase